VRENTGQKSLHDKSFRIEDKADTMLIFVQCRLHVLGLVELGFPTVWVVCEDVHCAVRLVAGGCLALVRRAGQEDGWRTVF